MTNNQEKLLRGKLTKWLVAKGGMPEDVESKTNAWLQYFDGIKKPVVALAACTWLCSGAVILPEDMPKVEQAVKVAELNRVDPLRYRRPMEIIDAFGAVELKEAPIDPDTVPTLHLAKRFDSGLAIYDVGESREDMRKIINTHFGKDSSPWCLLQGDGQGNLTEESLMYWNFYDAYPKQVAFVNGTLVAFSANDCDGRVWWDRQDEPHKDVVITGRIKGDPLGRSARQCYDPETGDVRYEDIFRRRDEVIVERYEDIKDTEYTLKVSVDKKKIREIKSLIIPQGVKIGEPDFYECSELEEVHFSRGVKIGREAFWGCPKLKKVSFSEDVEISDDAFRECPELKKVSFSEGVKIGIMAFRGCPKLKKVSFSEGVEIGIMAFYECPELEEVHFSRGVKIGGGAFRRCPELKKVSFSEGVEIGEDAFAECPELEEVRFSHGMKIGEGAFGFCDRLKKVSFSEGVEIGEGAFYECSELEEVYFSRGVKVGWQSFEGCYNLRRVIVADGFDKSLLADAGLPDGCRILTETEAAIQSQEKEKAPDFVIDEEEGHPEIQTHLSGEIPQRDYDMLIAYGFSGKDIENLGIEKRVNINADIFTCEKQPWDSHDPNLRSVCITLSLTADNKVIVSDPVSGKEIGDAWKVLSSGQNLNFLQIHKEAELKAGKNLQRDNTPFLGLK